ncbi:aminotransferase class I/II-fold pyridoxal phosphate-dependent enzyme [Mesorhizobium sp. CGMCC 1.15528]|uniref:aspartate transaminase n=1 Tax=Mesorhizobium zhangyense TaxID=1776730 RepID=A0A7C9VED1_9HYPH|nr:pyridoxal phosphate-dependent aminotransferase [Mesorhizobium zhangyense]NGN43092.1 aminotransferase class I/II-fold pyridoxal phosphate-dependent enzyme [Mesorhizobium zhangyense]
MTIQSKFSRLGTDAAPGQEVRQLSGSLDSVLRGDTIAGRPVDFSHGDVDAFTPTPHSFEVFSAGVEAGGKQAYTEYRGDLGIREELAERLASFTGAPVDARDGMIITPGTQGALFLAVASTVSQGDKVAIVQPDYFANRKLVEFCEGKMIPVRMDYATTEGAAGLDLGQLEDAFKSGAKVFLFSNPNNPVGVVYSREEIEEIAVLASRYNATVIVDQLYSRLLYSGVNYTHLRAQQVDAENVVTIMGPSKTESLSGYRLGVAFGSKEIISRMEKLQAIVSLRAGGYSQAVLRTWFNEPAGWMDERIRKHQAIRDDLLKVFRATSGIQVRTTEAGSYIFPALPHLSVAGNDFVRILRLQAGVIVTPGTEFSPFSESSVRLNFSQDHAAAVAASKRLVTLVDRYRA